MRHTYNLGIIGNCGFMAHISEDTNISWMCWPRFDSSFVFGSLIAGEKGGEFSVKPESDIKFTTQYYLENTNVLCTDVACGDGRYRVTDYAPRFLQFDRHFKPLMIIRKVEPLGGRPRIRVKCTPVGEYGEVQPHHYAASNHIEFMGLGNHMRLTTNIPLSYIMEDSYVALDEPKYLVLTYGAPLEAPLISTAEDFLKKTIQYWRGWVKSMSVSSFHQVAIIRSALCLKIHQYEDTGAIIAAGTTSLPEAPGSTRNWDYRYCWLRDAYYILTAFNNIGHFDELERYFNYIVNISVRTKERFQPLYSITGHNRIEEKILNLQGYDNNQPVRIGNQAYTHVQNDVYGQILLSLLPLYVDRRFINSERGNSLNLIEDILQKVNNILDEPCAGLWEFRNISQYHCYTYLFHWAGATAAKKIAHAFGNKRIIDLALNIIKHSSEKIEACYQKERGVYSQAVGTTNLDASNLQMIIMNYLDHDSESAKKHLKVLEEELKAKNGLFYRYKHVDDFGKPETTFMICAFWYVEALTCVGRIDEAIEAFEGLLGYRNHLGLLSEDVDPRTGSQWGNFPQAYSHVGLVNAAYRISRKLDLPNFF
jgi:GH15 family glucan-1,4-alpha-glucosidase